MHTGFSCRGREFSQLPGREAYECTKPAPWFSSRSRQAHRNFNLELHSRPDTIRCTTQPRTDVRK